MSKTDGVGAFKVDPHIVTVTGMGVLPIGDVFSLFGRAGLAHWWYDPELDLAGVGSLRFSEKSNELIWGAGASVFVDGGMLRLEYGQTKASPAFEGQTLMNFRLRVISLSLLWML